MAHLFDCEQSTELEENEQDFQAVILEITEKDDPQKFFEENDLPLKNNQLSLIEEEK